MTSRKAEEFDYLYATLMPALTRASVGDFSAELDLDRENSVRVNEILMGISVLFEVVRDQQRELSEMRTELQQHGRVPGLPLLDEVLGKSD